MSIHPAALPDEQLFEQCRIWRQRRSGPGGQHRNKVETAVFIEHIPTGFRGEASERRSQELNRRAALARLRVQLALSIRSPMDGVDNYVPTSVWSLRVRAGRVAASPDHETFPALLAEALDVATAARFDLAKAAAALGTTTSQLVKLLAREPSALASVNEKRREAGMHAYRA